MLKQVIGIIGISILVILTIPHMQKGLVWIVGAHDWISQLLTEVFSVGTTGSLLRNLLALLAIPVLIGLIPVIVYWLARRSFFPYFMQCVWVIWLLQTAALIIQFKAAV